MSAAALGPIVAGALVRARARALLESLSLGLAAAGVCLAAARASVPAGTGALAGVGLASALASALAGALVALAHGRAHWPDARRAARELDRGWNPRGELVTAWECETRAAGGLGAALVARVRERADRRALLRAMPGPSPGWAVPPLLALALISLAGEPGPPSGPGAQGAGSPAGFSSGRAPTGRAPSAGAARAGGMAAPRGRRSETEPPGARPADAEAGTEPGRAGSTDSGPGRGKPAGGEQEALARGGARRTMSGSRPNVGSDAGPAGSGRTGLAAPPVRAPLRWWPAEYDPIVTGWIEHLRASR